MEVVVIDGPRSILLKAVDDETTVKPVSNVSEAVLTNTRRPLSTILEGISKRRKSESLLRFTTQTEGR